MIFSLVKQDTNICINKEILSPIYPANMLKNNNDKYGFGGKIITTFDLKNGG